MDGDERCICGDGTSCCVTLERDPPPCDTGQRWCIDVVACSIEHTPVGTCSVGTSKSACTCLQDAAHEAAEQLDASSGLSFEDFQTLVCQAELDDTLCELSKSEVLKLADEYFEVFLSHLGPCSIDSCDEIGPGVYSLRSEHVVTEASSVQLNSPRCMPGAITVGLQGRGEVTTADCATDSCPFILENFEVSTGKPADVSVSVSDILPCVPISVASVRVSLDGPATGERNARTGLFHFPRGSLRYRVSTSIGSASALGRVLGSLVSRYELGGTNAIPVTGRYVDGVMQLDSRPLKLSVFGIRGDIQLSGRHREPQSSR